MVRTHDFNNGDIPSGDDFNGDNAVGQYVSLADLKQMDGEDSIHNAGPIVIPGKSLTLTNASARGEAAITTASSAFVLQTPTITLPSSCTKVLCHFDYIGANSIADTSQSANAAATDTDDVISDFSNYTQITMNLKFGIEKGCVYTLKFTDGSNDVNIFTITAGGAASAPDTQTKEFDAGDDMGLFVRLTNLGSDKALVEYYGRYQLVDTDSETNFVKRKAIVDLSSITGTVKITSFLDATAAAGNNNSSSTTEAIDVLYNNSIAITTQAAIDGSTFASYDNNMAVFGTGNTSFVAKITGTSTTDNILVKRAIIFPIYGE